jgi:2-oxoisovalerate dehydrogenase E2 component (dihydrolipoyl transacylase)
MSVYQFKLPDIGEGIAEAEIVAWHVKVGDRVEEDQQLADMMTDKATVEMESPVAGTVKKLAGEVGDQIAIGSVLVEIETEGGAAAQEEPAAASEEEQPLADGAEKPTNAQEKALPVMATVEPAKKSVPPEPVEGRSEAPEPRPSTSLRTNEGGESKHAKVLASPAVRQRARDLGIDLAEVKTSGDRIRHADLDAYLLYQGGSVSGRGAAARPDETIKVVGLRRKIAENMQEAKRRIPHFTLVEEFDVTDLEDTRAMMNRDRGDNPKLTLLPFLITAMGKALVDWPMLNATFDDDAMVLTRHGSMHLGMATQTPGGLMVPVIRDAQNKSVWQLAREIGRLAEAARSGKASRDELMGSTITLSSLGPMGGITSTPVINRPEVAIIAVNKVQELPVIIDGELEARKRMNLSLSCDHRVVDGWDAANFMQAMKAYIENPIRLLSA